MASIWVIESSSEGSSAIVFPLIFMSEKEAQQYINTSNVSLRYGDCKPIEYIRKPEEKP